MEKLDLRRDLKNLYSAPSKEPIIIDVPEMGFAMLDGAGDPNNSPAFQEAVGALYGISFTLKFMVKKSKAVDYPVMALEGLWWTAGMSPFDMKDKEKWQWTLMIMQPDVVTPALFSKAVEQVASKRDSPTLHRVRLERFREGPSAQIMHVGPYATEVPTIEKLHRYVGEQGYRLCGKHHEIYLGDPRRSAPDKLRTILRHPVEKAA